MKHPSWSPSPFRQAVIESDRTDDKAPVLTALDGTARPETDSDYRDLTDYMARNIKPGRRAWPPLWQHEQRLAAHRFFCQLPRDIPFEDRIEQAANEFELPKPTMRAIAKGTLGSFTAYRGPTPDLSNADDS